jgi:hypothetical protein
MSNGPDVIGAYGACQAARRDIREMQADEDSAKGHFDTAHKEAQNADKAKTPADKSKHQSEATEEKNKGKAASESADKHRDDAFKHLGEYHAKMGHDPRKGTPAVGKDGPDCKPLEPAVAKEIGKKINDALKGLTGPQKAGSRRRRGQTRPLREASLAELQRAAASTARASVAAPRWRRGRPHREAGARSSDATTSSFPRRAEGAAREFQRATPEGLSRKRLSLVARHGATGLTHEPERPGAASADVPKRSTAQSVLVPIGTSMEPSFGMGPQLPCGISTTCGEKTLRMDPSEV